MLFGSRRDWGQAVHDEHGAVPPADAFVAEGIDSLPGQENPQPADAPLPFTMAADDPALSSRLAAAAYSVSNESGGDGSAWRDISACSSRRAAQKGSQPCPHSSDVRRSDG